MDSVSAIYSVKGARGGKHVEDQFDIVASDLVAELVGPFNKIGHGALVFREMRKTAVMLVPPRPSPSRRGARTVASPPRQSW